MKGIWKGIKAMKEEAPKDLVRKDEGEYQFYSAPAGHKLILSGVALAPETWTENIKDYGWLLKGGHPGRIFYRGFERGRGTVIADTEEPVLELVEI